MADIVATGMWQWYGTVYTEVRIVRLDFDFWYVVAEADEVLGDRGSAGSQPWRVPPLRPIQARAVV